MIKTWKTSTDPDYEAKKNRVLELYDIADGKTAPGDGDPQIVFCMDEFGGEQRRAGLRPDERIVADPDRVPVHRVALLHARRDRSSLPRGAELDDAPLHRLTQPPQRQRGTSWYLNARKGCLTRH